jgi:Holliday junction resolvase RusA-like endonuclease
VSEFTLTVEGPPVGKDRPRFRVVAPKGKRPFVHVYTTKETEAAEEAFRTAWRESGSPVVEGAFNVVVEAHCARPATHYLKDGYSLSAEGRRHRYPENRKPDLDNVLKLVLDALNGHAYKDDVAAVYATARRHWGTGSERTRVWISAAG